MYWVLILYLLLFGLKIFYGFNFVGCMLSKIRKLKYFVFIVCNIKFIVFYCSKLDMEDFLEQFEESDENVDNKVIWKEYLFRNYGFDINDFKDYIEEDVVSEFIKVSEGR